MNKKQWYAIRDKKSKSNKDWQFWELTKKEISGISGRWKYIGPFDSMEAAIKKADENKQAGE